MSPREEAVFGIVSLVIIAIAMGGFIPAPFIAFFGGSSATTGCEWIFDCWIETRPRVMERFPNGR